MGPARPRAEGECPQGRQTPGVIMALTTACPDRQEFAQLVQGQLAAPDVERLAQHLEQCSRCSRLVHQLPGGDPLFETIRAARPVVLAATDTSRAEGLIDR